MHGRNNAYTSPLFHSDSRLGYWCRIYTEANGKDRRRYGIIQRGVDRRRAAQRVRVSFVKRDAGWAAQTKGPCGDAIMECAGRTQLEALIRLGEWCAEEWNREEQPKPRHCPHCDRECEPGRFVCLDSDCPRFD